VKEDKKIGLVFTSEPHAYYLHGIKIPNVTSVLQEEKLSPDYSRVDDAILTRALEVGRAVHKACELDDWGDLDWYDIDDVLYPYLKAWRNFLDDYPQLDMQKDWIEKPIASLKYKYAGTPDRLMVDNIEKKNGVIDIKTCTSYHPSHQLQLTAYKIPIEEVYGIPIDFLWTVYLDENSKYRVKPFEADCEAWLSALRINNWKKIHL
jgi:hypothetical protein